MIERANFKTEIHQRQTYRHRRRDGPICKRPAVARNHGKDRCQQRGDAITEQDQVKECAADGSAGKQRV